MQLGAVDLAESSSYENAVEIQINIRFNVSTESSNNKSNMPATMPYVKQSTMTFGASELEAKPMNQTTPPISDTIRQPYRPISTLKTIPDTCIQTDVVYKYTVIKSNFLHVI